MSNVSDANSSCFETFNAPKYWFLIAVRAALGFLSCCFIFCMISIIVLFKKYHFFTQRLILYLAISAFGYSASNMFNVIDPIAYKSRPALYYCMALGFAEQVLIWWEIMAFAVMLFDVFIRVVIERDTEKLEVIYVLMIFLFPVMFSVIPFGYLAYGPAGGVFCWIRNRDLEDCSKFDTGNWLRFGLYYIPLYCLVGTLLILLVLSLSINRYKQKRFVGNLDAEGKRIRKLVEKEVSSLVYYPMIFIAINFIVLARRLYGAYYTTDDTGYYVLSLIGIIIFRLEGVIITMVFTLDPATKKKLNKNEFKAALLQWKSSNQEQVQEYKFKEACSDSYAKSHDMTHTVDS